MSSQRYGVQRYLDRHSSDVNATTQNNASNAAASGVRHSETFILAHTAKYEVKVPMDCSLNATNSDFIAELIIDNNVVRTMRAEFKDSAGASINGSGTNQEYTRTLEWEGELPAGSHDFVFRFRPQTNGVTATVHWSVLKVQRWI